MLRQHIELKSSNPHNTECVGTERMRVNGEKGKEETNKQKSYTKFHAFNVVVCFWECLKVEKVTFLQEKKCHTECVLPFSCNFVKNTSSIKLLFSHIAEEIFLYKMQKLQIILIL